MLTNRRDLAGGRGAAIERPVRQAGVEEAVGKGVNGSNCEEWPRSGPEVEGGESHHARCGGEKNLAGQKRACILFRGWSNVQERRDERQHDERPAVAEKQPSPVERRTGCQDEEGPEPAKGHNRLEQRCGGDALPEEPGVEHTKPEKCR